MTMGWLFHLTPDRRELPDQSRLADLGMQQCPYCAALLPDDATICSKCDSYVRMHVVRDQIIGDEPS